MYTIKTLNAISPVGLAKLNNKQFDVAVDTDAPDGILVRSADMLNTAFNDNLLAIARAGAGVNNIPLDRCSEQGIVVFNTPGANANAVAELVIGMLIAGSRNVAAAAQWCQGLVGDPAMAKTVEKGKKQFVGNEIKGKTLGVIGLGAIGSRVANCAIELGMEVYGYDPYISIDAAWNLSSQVHHCVNLNDMLPLCDYITIHVPYLPTTKDTINAQTLALCKDGVKILNYARGELVNTAALLEAMDNGKVSGYMTDFPSEAILGKPGIVCTPHLGASTHEAQVRAGVQIAEYVSSGLEGSIVPTALNMTLVPPEMMDAVGPYVPACQMMGRILAQILGCIPKTLRVEAAGTIANADASILVAGALDGILAYRRAGSVTSVNVESVAVRHGIKVDTASIADADEYASAVKVVADGVEVGATLFGSMQRPRIMSLLDYKIDIAPAKQSLVFEYVDAPGRIGAIGTLLGNEGVNITTMQIGTKPSEKTALVYMNVEGNVNDQLLEKLSSTLDFKNVWSFSL